MAVIQVTKAKEQPETAVQLGFGSLETVVTTQTNERSPTFAKQSIIDLSPSAKELLAKWDID